MLKGMKKKKSKKPKAEDGEEAGDAAPADGELDLSMMKKKKKSKKPKEGAEDDFEAKLAALDLEGKGPEGEAATEQKPVEEGDMDQGTGIVRITTFLGYSHCDTPGFGNTNVSAVVGTRCNDIDPLRASPKPFLQASGAEEPRPCL